MQKIPSTFKDQSVDTGRHIHARVMTVLNKATPFLKIRNREDVYLYIPEFYQAYWFDYLRSLSIHKFTEKIETFNGYKILPGYEHKIILAHRSHVIDGSGQLISQVKI